MNMISPTIIGAHLNRVKEERPLVHCLTNFVAMPFTANVLLACHMNPAMVIEEREIEDFAPICDSLLINIGTLETSAQPTMLQAAEAMNRLNKPWVLDPVAAHPSLKVRYKFAEQLLSLNPAVVRGNPDEIIALAKTASFKSAGANSHHSSLDALEPAKTLANTFNTVVVVTGSTDYITDGCTVISIPMNVSELTYITATGCALGAIIAGYIASSSRDDRLEAAASACALMKTAGFYARKSAKGPGSLSVHLLDEFFNMNTEKISKVFSSIKQRSF